MEEAKIRLKPLWKSAGFWMGACMTLFLVWVWVDSRSHLTNFGLRDTPRALEVTVRNSQVIVGISLPDKTRSASGAGRMEWVWDRSPHRLMGSPGSPEGPWFPAGKIDRIARYQSVGGGPPGRTPSRLMFEGDEISVPFWVIVFGWVVVWLSAIRFYRSWQRKRAAAASKL